MCSRAPIARSVTFPPWRSARHGVEEVVVSVIAFPAAATRVSAQSVTSLIPAWRISRLADGHRPRGVASYVAKVEQFVAWCGDLAPREISADLIQRYKVALYERELAMGTIRHSLTVLRSFCGWCVDQGVLTSNPALSVAHPRVEQPDPDPLTRLQIDQLLAALDRPPQSHKLTWRRNRRAVALGLYAGMRIAEIAELRWGDVDLARGEIIIRKQAGKGGKSRVVPICVELEDELKPGKACRAKDAVVDQGNGKPLTVKSLAHIFERWLDTRGVHIHAHQLRKTFATELYVAGEDLATIQRLLGHTDPKTTMRYLGASAPKERAAVQKLRFRATPPDLDKTDEES